MTDERPGMMSKSINTIVVLIVMNVIMALITEQMPGMYDKMFELFALYFPKNDHFKYWQFVTSIFMHGGFTHLLFNMYGLWAFGSPLEQIWGKSRFLLFYFLCGIGAGLIYTLVNYFQFNSIYNELISLGMSSTDIQTLLETKQYNPQVLSTFSKERLSEFYSLFAIPAVGASGAIYGILVAFAFLFPNAKLALLFLPFPIAAKYFIPILIAIDLFSGLTGFSIFGGGVAHFAHVGGALIGFLLMLLWRKQALPQDEEEFE